MSRLASVECAVEEGESFEILRRVRVSASIGFIKAYDEYAREAFRMHGLRYLTKPLQIDELRELVQVVCDRIDPPQPHSPHPQGL